MALGWKTPPEPDEDFETVYQASRGGWFPKDEEPVPGTPQQED